MNTNALFFCKMRKYKICLRHAHARTHTHTDVYTYNAALAFRNTTRTAQGGGRSFKDRKPIIEFLPFSYLFQSLRISVPLSFFLSFFFSLSLSLSISISLHTLFVELLSERKHS